MRFCRTFKFVCLRNSIGVFDPRSKIAGSISARDGTFTFKFDTAVSHRIGEINCIARSYGYDYNTLLIFK